MLNTTGRLTLAALLAALNLIFTLLVFPQEETEYKRFKLEDASCDAGICYKKTLQGLTRKIENLETERGLAYKAWFEKKHERDKSYGLKPLAISYFFLP